MTLDSVIYPFSYMHTPLCMPLSYAHILINDKHLLFDRLKDREEIDRAKQLMETLKSEHVLELKSLQTTTDNEIKSIKSTHENEIISLKDAHEGALRALTQTHEQSLVTLKDSHDQSITALTRGNDVTDNATILPTC